MMQEALDASATRINNGSAEPQPRPADTIGAIMSALPKLLRNNEPTEEVLEKLDALQAGGIAPLREQIQILRKRCSLMLKSQEQVLAKMDELQRQQSAVARVVLDLARQMARITFTEVEPIDDDEREAPPAPDTYRRGEFRTNGDERRRSQRETLAEHGPRSRAGRSR